MDIESDLFTGPPGDSLEQREAEHLMISALACELGVVLESTVVTLADGCRMEVDGATQDRSILVEAWAHQGPPKSAQKAKVCKDALKLALAGKTVAPWSRRILLFCDPEAARPFLGRGWESSALKEFEIEVMVRPLPQEVRDLIRAAQERQYR